MIGSIDNRVRPIRIAHLVDPGSKSQIRGAIQLSSTLWGGAYFPILPAYKRAPSTWAPSKGTPPPAKEVLLGNLAAYDPDILVQFSSWLPEYVSDLGLPTESPADIWAETQGLPRYGIGITELLNDVFDEYFKYKLRDPVRVVVPQMSGRLALFWASYFGELHPEVHQLVRDHFYERLEVEEIDSSATLMRDLIFDRALFPRRITDWAIHRSPRRGSGTRASLFFLDASRTDDVIDYWNLRATGREVLPVPRQLVGSRELMELVVKFATTRRRWVGKDHDILDLPTMICARSCRVEEMRSFLEAVRTSGIPGADETEPLVSLQHWYPRIWDDWARDKDSAIPCDIYGEEESNFDVGDLKDWKFQFTPILPSFAQRYAPHSSPRCANELSFRFFGADEYLAEALPKSSAGDHLTRAIAGFGSFRHWRLGRNGLVNLVQFRWTRIRTIPKATTVFFAWLADHGWEAELSPPGLLAMQLYRRLDGRPIVLRNETLLGLLEHLNGGHVGRDMSPRTGKATTSEREMPVGEVKNRLNESDSDLVDYLASKGVFKLGLTLQCATCLRGFWVSVEGLADEVICPRCQEPMDAIGSVEAGTWSYRSAGPFSVAQYADGAYAVLLALEFFDDTRLTGLRTTRVPSFSAVAPGGRRLEADYALLWHDSSRGDAMDGVLFGESKTYGRFKREDFSRMRGLAKNFPGAVLVFSTLRCTLSKKEIRGISSVARSGRKYWKPERPLNPVLILTGNELMDPHGPPFCWDEATQRRFRNMRGLLGLCDATQQLYLDLPSWETEWHEDWQKRRKQRKTLED